jgi:chromosome segregation ATPase
LKADVATLNATAQRMEYEIASLKQSIERIEARLRQDHSHREDLREQIGDCRRRVTALEERVQAMEGRLPTDG